jgi:hypothetical protein
MDQERRPDQQIDAQQAGRLFAKVAKFARKHGGHLIRKDHDTSGYAPDTGELCIGSKLTPQQALEHIVYETAMLLNSRQPFSSEGKRVLAAGVTSRVLHRYGLERSMPPTPQQVYEYYHFRCAELEEFYRMLDTAERITRMLAKPKPKLARLGRSWDPLISQAGTILPMQKPGVREWPYTRVKITARGYYKLVYEIIGQYRHDDRGWYRVSDWPTKHVTSKRSEPAGRAEGTEHEPDVPPDDIPF